MSAVATWEKILPQQGNDWTLAEDAALASQLKLFSQQLFAKTKELENSIWELGLAAEKSDVRLNNTINHFLMLSDSQFIENRVYEEDEDEIVKDEMKTTTEPSSTATTAPGESTTTDSKDVATEDAKKKEIQVVDQYRTALTLGMEALKLFAVGDEEDVLDIYNERPLPFVIGTKEFLEDEYLGLGAAPDSDDENDEDESGEDYSSEEEESEEEESEEDEEEGSEEEESDEESIEPVQAKRPPMPPMPPPRPSEEWENESTDDLFGHRTPKPRAQASAAPSRRGLFGMDDDDDDDSDDSHPGPSTSKAKSNSLFAPEDLGRDLFDGKPSAAAPAPPPKLDLFGELRARAGKTRVASDDDSDEGLFGSSSKPPARQPSAAATPAGLSLFGESDSDAESSSSGLFGRQTSTAKDLKRPPPGAVPLPQQLTRADSNDSSLFGTTTRPRAEAKQPANAKSSKLLFDSDDDSDDGGGLFGVASKAPVPPAASIAAAQPKATPPVPAKTASAKATSPSSFFNDGSDDDSDDGLLFGSKPTPPPEKLQPPIQSQPQMPPIQRPLPTAVPPKASTLFGGDSDSDSDDDGGLFGRPAPPAAPASKPASVTVTETVTTTATIAPAQSPQTRLHSLFQSQDYTNESSANLFSTPKSPRSAAVQRNASSSAAPAKSPATNLFGGDESDNESNAGDLFGAPPPKPTATAKPPPAAGQLPAARTPVPDPVAVIAPTGASTISKPAAKVDSDDDWSDDDGGLFGRASVGMSTKPPLAAANPTPNTASNVFGSATQSSSTSSLFGGAPQPTSSASLFGNAAATHQPAATLSSASAAASSSSSLFGDPRVVSAASNVASTATLSDAKSWATSSSSLFGDQSSATTAGAVLRAAPPAAILGTVATVASSSADLFGSDAVASSSLFGHSSTSTTALPTSSSSTILIGDAPKPVAPAATRAPPPPTASRLFEAQDSDSDGWSDDDASLFGPPKRK